MGHLWLIVSIDRMVRKYILVHFPIQAKFAILGSGELILLFAGTHDARELHSSLRGGEHGSVSRDHCSKAST
jgi:hypothetical protein